MWTIGFIEGINQSHFSIKINSQINTKFELDHIDSSYKVNEIIGVEFDEVLALTYRVPPFYRTDFYTVTSDYFKVINICHFSRLSFIIDNNLATYVHLNTYIGNSDVSDCSQDDLKEVANTLCCSSDSMISKNMRADGISDILSTDLLCYIINNDSDLEYRLEKYIEDQDIGNSNYLCSNLWRRKIEIKIFRNISYCGTDSLTNFITVVNNTGYPDNYLNSLFYIKILSLTYGDIHVQDKVKSSHIPYCAKLELEKDYVTNHLDELEKKISNLLKETNEKALKRYSKEDHLQYLLKQCRLVRFLFKCRSEAIYKKIATKVGLTYGITNENGIKDWWLKDEDERIPDLREYIVQ